MSDVSSLVEIPAEIDRDLRAIFADVLQLDPSSLSPNTHLIDDLAVDSLDALELALRIQDRMKIELDEKHFSSFTTYAQVAACVVDLLGATADRRAKAS